MVAGLEHLLGIPRDSDLKFKFLGKRAPKHLWHEESLNTYGGVVSSVTNFQQTCKPCVFKEISETDVKNENSA